MTDKPIETPFRDQMALWSSGIAEEIIFWSAWAKTKGDRWPEDFIMRLDPNSTLQGPVTNLIDELGTNCKILDVGAGPLTYLNKTYKGATLAIDACDPLATAYDAILQINDIAPPVATVFADAEHLSAFYKPNAYDITHCRNALDHSLAPWRGIEEMLRVTKVGGYAVLVHYLNEAEFGNYEGLHQYNFDITDGRLIIWNKSMRLDVKDSLPIKTEITATDTGGRMFLAVIKKLEDFSDSAPSRHTADTAMLLEYAFDQAIDQAMRQMHGMQAA